MSKEIDFERDLKTAIKKEYGYIDIKIPTKAQLSDTLIDYLTIHKKVILPIPRKVKISPDLKTKLDSHYKKKRNQYCKGTITAW